MPTTNTSRSDMVKAAAAELHAMHTLFFMKKGFVLDEWELLYSLPPLPLPPHKAPPIASPKLLMKKHAKQRQQKQQNMAAEKTISSSSSSSSSSAMTKNNNEQQATQVDTRIGNCEQVATNKKAYSSSPPPPHASSSTTTTQITPLQKSMIDHLSGTHIDINKVCADENACTSCDISISRKEFEICANQISQNIGYTDSQELRYSSIRSNYLQKQIRSEVSMFHFDDTTIKKAVEQQQQKEPISSSSGVVVVGSGSSSSSEVAAAGEEDDDDGHDHAVSEKKTDKQEVVDQPPAAMSSRTTRKRKRSSSDEDDINSSSSNKNNDEKHSSNKKKKKSSTSSTSAPSSSQTNKKKVCTSNSLRKKDSNSKPDNASKSTHESVSSVARSAAKARRGSIGRKDTKSAPSSSALQKKSKKGCNPRSLPKKPSITRNEKKARRGTGRKAKKNGSDADVKKDDNSMTEVDQSSEGNKDSEQASGLKTTRSIKSRQRIVQKATKKKNDSAADEKKESDSTGDEKTDDSTAEVDPSSEGSKSKNGQDTDRRKSTEIIGSKVISVEEANSSSKETKTDTAAVSDDDSTAEVNPSSEGSKNIEQADVGETIEIIGSKAISVVEVNSSSNQTTTATETVTDEVVLNLDVDNTAEQLPLGSKVICVEANITTKETTIDTAAATDEVVLNSDVDNTSAEQLPLEPEVISAEANSSSKETTTDTAAVSEEVGLNSDVDNTASTGRSSNPRQRKTTRSSRRNQNFHSDLSWGEVSPSETPSKPAITKNSIPKAIRELSFHNAPGVKHNRGTPKSRLRSRTRQGTNDSISNKEMVCRRRPRTARCMTSNQLQSAVVDDETVDDRAELPQTPPLPPPQLQQQSQTRKRTSVMKLEHTKTKKLRFGTPTVATYVINGPTDQFTVATISAKSTHTAITPVVAAAATTTPTRMSTRALRRKKPRKSV